MTRSISKTEWALWFLIVASLACLLAGCGTTREETQHAEYQDQSTTKTKETRKTYKPTETGALALVDVTEVTTTSQQVTQGEKDAQITAEVKLRFPEAEQFIGAATNLVAPGFGGIVSQMFGWLTGTPEGAGTGLAAATLAAGLVKRGISGEINMRKKDRHLKAIVKGNSDFMQAHPDLADKLKDAQRSAQADPELKATIKKVRVEQGLA